MNVFPGCLERLQRALVEAESQLGLLDSLMPENFHSERERLVECFRQGQPSLPDFRFAFAHERVRRAQTVSTVLSAARIVVSDLRFEDEVPEELASLLSGRLDELALEVHMLTECGNPDFRVLAARRFGLTDAELARSDELALRWVREEESEEPGGGEVLLASVFEEKRKALGPVGAGIIVMERNLASVCAVGARHLYVRRGARVSALEAERLWVHEVEGHLLPRLRAEKAPTPFAIGTPGCVVDEEGWAVWLEERHGLLTARRRREIASRFRLALSLHRRGAEGVLELLAVELEGDCEPEVLATTICRIFRGGGLARESIYLPGYLRVRAALESVPARAHYFEMGRVSVAALPYLAQVFP